MSDFVRGEFAGFDGDRLPGVPRNQVTLALDHTQPLGHIQLLYHLDGSYRSAVTTTINDALAQADGEIVHNAAEANYHELSGFTVLNASVGVQLAQLLARLYVNNMTNQQGITAWTTHFGDPP